MSLRTRDPERSSGNRLSRVVARMRPLRRLPSGAALLLGLATVLAAFFAGRAAVILTGQGFEAGVLIVGASCVGLSVLRPFLGLCLTLAVVPLSAFTESAGVAFASSVLGAATVMGYFVQQLDPRRARPMPPLNKIHLVAATLVVWIIASDPSAALGGGGSRSWAATYVQLWVLMWVTSVVADTTQRRRALLAVLAVSAVVSVGAAMILAEPAPQTVLGDRNPSRFAGLTGGPNAAARIFIAGIIAAIGWGIAARGLVARVAAGGAVCLLLVGIGLTLSRTGYLLVVLVPMLLILAGARSTHRTVLQVIVLALVFASVFAPASIRSIEAGNIARNEVEETSTFEIRRHLWASGIAMWRDHPFEGVGVGRFNANLQRYGVRSLLADRRDAGAHSAYVGILAENGIVGLGLFLWLIVACLHALRRSRATTLTAERAWWVVLAILLIGALTKHDQYDKLLWMVFGIAASVSARGPRAAVAPRPVGQARSA